MCQDTFSSGHLLPRWLGQNLMEFFCLILNIDSDAAYCKLLILIIIWTCYSPPPLSLSVSSTSVDSSLGFSCFLQWCNFPPDAIQNSFYLIHFSSICYSIHLWGIFMPLNLCLAFCFQLMQKDSLKKKEAQHKEGIHAWSPTAFRLLMGS